MHVGWRLVVAALVSGFIAVGTAACGSSSSTNSAGSGSSSSSGGSASSTPAADTSSGACGTAKFTNPTDPDGVFAKLPAATQADYNGYEYPVYASKWDNWKPVGKSLSVGISWDEPTNDFAAGTLATVEAAVKQMPNVGKVTTLASAADTDIPAQIQQYESLLQQKPSLLILATTAGQPFVPLVAKAAKEGIPTISVLATVDSPDAVSVVPNTYLAALQTTESIVKQIGGKGNALMVQGIPGLSITTDATDGIEAVLKNCPDITTVGTITGGFQPAVAKAQAISFLGTHPQTINVALIGGGMSSGVISAFQQTGRTIPAMTDQSITKATAGYWLAHKASFKASISGGGAVAFGQLVNLVAEKMLAGDGLKVSSVVQPQPIITPSNISDWAQTSWTVSTPGTAPDPANAYDNPALVDPLFNK